MKNEWKELVYAAVQGDLIVPLQGVDNAFAPGSRCEVLYSEMLDAYGRLCRRLGQIDEDADVEIIINNLLEIQWIVGMKMYDYGAHFGNRRES